MITLTLTDAQADILGYALLQAERVELAKAEDPARRPDSPARRGAAERLRRIQDMRDALDVAPDTRKAARP